MGIRIANFRPIGLATAGKDAIAVDGHGKIAGPDEPIAETLDCQGAYLSPGWADLHVHIWYGGTDISVRPGFAGRATGVTALADAGSAGEANFHGLREYVIDKQPETIKAFINIGSIGLVACNRVSELGAMSFIDAERTLDVIELNRDVVCGVKVRASGLIVGKLGITPVRIAKLVAETAQLPLMVHCGEPPPLVDEILDVLAPGDVLTHCFHGKPAGSIRDTQSVFALAKQAADAGIHMDVGHGAESFDFEVARESIAEGLVPYSISTDLHARNIHDPVYDLASTMAKMHAVGMSLEECIAAVTTRPRGFLGLDNSGALADGAQADFTVFDVVDSEREACDCMGNRIVLLKSFEPRFTVIGNSVLPAKRTAGNTEGRKP